MNRRGFLSLFGGAATGAVAVGAGLRPEVPTDPTPTPTDRLRVNVGGVWHDVLTVPSKTTPEYGEHIKMGPRPIGLAIKP